MDDPLKLDLSSNRMETKPPLKPEKFSVDNNESVEVTLEPGPIAFCGCGKSNTFPFCDGTQNGKRFRRVSYKIAEKRNAWLCENHRINNSNREELIQLEV